MIIALTRHPVFINNRENKPLLFTQIRATKPIRRRDEKTTSNAFPVDCHHLVSATPIRNESTARCPDLRHALVRHRRLHTSSKRYGRETSGRNAYAARRSRDVQNRGRKGSDARTARAQGRDRGAQETRDRLSF